MTSVAPSASAPSSSGAPPSVPASLSSLDSSLSIPLESLLSGSLVSLEEHRLDEFLLEFSRAYEFPRDSQIHKSIFSGLLQRRLLSPEFLTSLARSHQLRILRVIRVYTRDAAYQRSFLKSSAHRILTTTCLTTYSASYFSSPADLFGAELLIEVISILKRLVSNDQFQAKLFDVNFVGELVKLLEARDSSLLSSVLVTLIHLSPHGRFASAVIGSSLVERLLDLIQERSSVADMAESSRFECLAGELIDLLIESAAIRMELIALGGNAIFLRLAHSALIGRDYSFLTPLVRLIASMALEPDSSREIRLLGGVPILVELLSSLTVGLGHSIGQGNKEEQEFRPFADSSPASVSHSNLLINLCVCLTQLCLDDENAVEIRKRHGIEILSTALLQCCRATVADRSPDSKLTEFSLFALRCLRFLYSVERNRGVFKKIFPAAIFAEFIDIGHYKHDIALYRPALQSFQALDTAAIDAIQQTIRSIRGDQPSVDGGLPSSGQAAPDGSGRVIRGYTVIEVLGRGAFGTVYQVRKDGSDAVYALKELPLSQYAISDAGDAHSEAALSKTIASLCGEVEILAQLDHPNIVRYYASFVANDSLYIVMEYVEGLSLNDYLQSLIDKGILMTEETIWRIFIQLCLALCYMHCEKRVVHRDLTPANIMLKEGKRRVLITDFGLARQTHSDTILQSSVGTISYSCPEIVQHQSYTSKADVWALGAILFQLATCKPAFGGNNPLTVAHKIVSGKYDQALLDQCGRSPMMKTMIGKLLTVDPQARPDILHVSALIAPLLMAELDRQNIENLKLNSLLKEEREARARAIDQFNREKQSVRKLIKSQSQTSSKGDGEAPISVNATKLREVEDPATLLLRWVHKLVFISQLPPQSARDPKRSIVIKFKRALFGQQFDGRAMKEILMSLAAARDSSVPSHLAGPSQGKSLTFAHLHRLIDEILAEPNVASAFDAAFSSGQTFESASKPAPLNQFNRRGSETDIEYDAENQSDAQTDNDRVKSPL